MASGGARARSGPAPDPQALRRDRDSRDWTTLPAEGRKGRPPAWPLDPKASRRESVVWQRLWRKPQAVMWEQRRIEDLVALYCRRFVEAERHDTTASQTTLVRQLADDLGLTNAGLARERWRIAPDEVAAKRDAPRPRATATSSTRDRLRAVTGGGA